MEPSNELGIELGKRDNFNGSFFEEGNVTPHLTKKFEECDECDSFLCDECTADIDADKFWVCDDECDCQFGLCEACYNEYKDGQLDHPCEADSFLEVPNMFNMKNYAIFCKKNDYIARGNKTMTLIGNHPLTTQAIVSKEDDPDNGDTWKVTFYNKLFAKDPINGYIVGSEEMAALIRTIAETVPVTAEGFVLNLIK